MQQKEYEDKVAKLTGDVLEKEFGSKEAKKFGEAFGREAAKYQYTVNPQQVHKASEEDFNQAKAIINALQKG